MEPTFGKNEPAKEVVEISLAEYEANAPLQKRKRPDYDTVEVNVGLVGAGEQPCMTEVAGTGIRGCQCGSR